MNSLFQFHQTKKGLPFSVFYDTGDNLIPNHWHKEVEVVWVLKNSVRMIVNNTIHDLNENDLCFLADGDSHAYFPSEGHKRLVLLFSPKIVDVVSEGVQQRDVIWNFLKTRSNFSSDWNKETAEEARALLQEMIDSITGDSLAWELESHAALYKFIVLLCRSVPPETKHTKISEHSKTLSQLESILNCVERNYAENIALSSVAREMGFDKSYFARMFKKYMNVTFMEYLTNYRIIKACELLATKEESIQKIAYMVGFGSIKTFNRVFKKVEGRSPSAYKKSIFEDNKS